MCLIWAVRFRVVADRLVEGLLRLDGDIESTAPLVTAYQQAQKDQSPLVG